MNAPPQGYGAASYPYQAQQIQFSQDKPAGKMAVQGRRVRTNVPALFMALILPFLLFVVVYYFLMFAIHYKHPGLCWFVVALATLVPILFGTMWFMAKRHQVDLFSQPIKDRPPTWYLFLFATSVLAWVFAVLFGSINYSLHMVKYYDVATLNSYPNVDPAYTKGQQVMDAGTVVFSEGSRLDLTKATGLKHDDVYCVAPIISGSVDAPLGSYDFWAVGKNCCESNYLGFQYRCGEWNNPRANAGLRVLVPGDQDEYRMAVLQSTSANRIQALHPLFFEWMQDPLAANNTHQDRGFKHFLLGIFCFLSFQLLATCGYALLSSRWASK